MKKALVLLFVIVLAMPSFSQDKKDVASEKNVLKINALSLLLGTGSVFYERKFSDMTSGQLGVAYMGLKIGDTRFTGLILTPEFRIYPKKNAIDGFYIAPYLRYQSFTVKNATADADGTLSSMGGGLLFGREWIKKSGFTMDLFFGGHYGSSSLKLNSGSSSSINSNFLSGFGVRVGFALGFAF
jgi:Protein of unknown function (DUF3575)